ARPVDREGRPCRSAPGRGPDRLAGDRAPRRAAAPRARLVLLRRGVGPRLLGARQPEGAEPSRQPPGDPGNRRHPRRRGRGDGGGRGDPRRRTGHRGAAGVPGEVPERHRPDWPHPRVAAGDLLPGHPDHAEADHPLV
ncbi:MAG: Pyridoxamine 5'-phosphate oxidase, partial [uncultured Thermomicrobiales bacterium]